MAKNPKRTGMFTGLRLSEPDSPPSSRRTRRLAKKLAKLAVKNDQVLIIKEDVKPVLH